MCSTRYGDLAQLSGAALVRPRSRAAACGDAAGTAAQQQTPSRTVDGCVGQCCAAGAGSHGMRRVAQPVLSPPRGATTAAKRDRRIFMSCAELVGRCVPCSGTPGPGAPAFDTMAGYPARVNELINGSLGRGTSCATVPRTGQGGGATCGCCMALGQPPRLAFPGDARCAHGGEFGHISRAF